jgi:hypothetical protein
VRRDDQLPIYTILHITAWFDAISSPNARQSGVEFDDNPAISGASRRFPRRFGAFAVDSARRRLLRGGEPIWLQPRVMDVLLLLVAWAEG